MPCKRPQFTLPLAILVLQLLAAGQPIAAAESPAPLAALEQAVPTQPTKFTAPRVEQLIATSSQLYQWFLLEGEKPWNVSAADSLARVNLLTGTKHRVDTLLESTLTLRGEFAGMPAGESQREHVRQFLRATSELIDLSGRLRYALRDSIDSAAYTLEADDRSLASLLHVLHEQRSSIGAAVMIYLLDEPADPTIPPVPLPLKLKLLDTIAATRQSDLLPQLSALLLSGRGEPELIVAVAATVESLGLPQEIRPGQDPTLPPPPITAAQLHRRLMRLDPAQLSPTSAAKLSTLLTWSKARAEHGIQGDTFRVAGFDLQPGDWLLMRNPSPYNHFTDLAPGLFTHVGVVATEHGADGQRRFVIVEMPEQSSHIPATNVDAYLLRTLHYFFVRHEDPAACQTMAVAAASMIGNESQFDLQFRTDRVTQLAGQSLANRPIHTYCAGFLLLCALQTEHARESYFPLAEHAPNANCQKNLGTLGMAIGDDFISPTGALFSPHTTIVAQRRPMYEPTREVKEAVYNHFAARMIHSTLTPSPTAYQSLREKLAGMSKQSPWLARALARANNVSERMDLESAAKAAAVVETLDEIADDAMNQFISARTAFHAGPLEGLAAKGFTPQHVQNVEAYRRRHLLLWNAWVANELTPRGMREALVEFYVVQGKRRLDDRFFPTAQGE